LTQRQQHFHYPAFLLLQKDKQWSSRLKRNTGEIPDAMALSNTPLALCVIGLGEILWRAMIIG
jgi:hypothetical protein